MHGEDATFAGMEPHQSRGEAAAALRDAENEPTHIPPVATVVMKLYGSGGVGTWGGVEDVCALLHALQLGADYEESFREHGIDVTLLLTLSKADMVNVLGVNKLSARRVLMDLQSYMRQLQDKEVRKLPEDGRLLTLFDNMRQTLTWFRLSVILLQYAVYTVPLAPLYAEKSLAVALGMISVIYAMLVAIYTTYRYSKVVHMVEDMHEDYRPDKLSLLIPGMLILVIAMLTLTWVANGSAQRTEGKAPDQTSQQASSTSFIEPLVFLVLSVA